MQAVIFDRDTKILTTYSPLVTDSGVAPAINPNPVTLPVNSDVALFGGGNDDATYLIGDGAASCVNGAGGAIFGQVFFCNSQQFFTDVNAAHIAIPKLGTGTNARPCPSVRDFRIVDQDQSDNVQVTYLATPSGQTAQDTSANRLSLQNYTILGNGSDNTLLSKYVDPALGCKSWAIPDVGDQGHLKYTQATNELQARAYQQKPIARVPAGDPMVGPNNLALLNAYRVNVDQFPVASLAGASTKQYCTNLQAIAPPFLSQEQAVFQTQPSPVPGENLYNFMESRLANSFYLLGCSQLRR